MARPLRIEYPGAFYHVISRGNAGCTVFKSIRDREKFFEYLEKAVERFSIRVHTYCLMTNHFHLLLETPNANLSKAVQWINVSYATYFNRKRGRKGHLFQGRFKSILIDADEYLKHLSRYIHLNPVRARMVDRPDEYRWSSYPYFTGKKEAPEWLEMDWLLSQFGKDRKTSWKNYKRFVEDIDIKELGNLSDDITGWCILGAPEFVDWVKDTFLKSRETIKEIPQLKALKSFTSVEKVVETVSREFECDAELIMRKGGKKNLPRDMAIYLARDLTGETTVMLGKKFGNILGAAISQRYIAFEKQMKKTKYLNQRMMSIRKKILDN